MIQRDSKILKKMKKTITLLFVATVLTSFSQQGWQGKFEQLGQELPTPNGYRTGSGAPGPKYWQQRADYVLSAEVNDDKIGRASCRERV